MITTECRADDLDGTRNMIRMGGGKITTSAPITVLDEFANRVPGYALTYELV